MTFILLFSFILLSWTHLVGIGASDMCIVKMSSKYSRESQYCSSVLDHLMQNKDKANVCSEIFHLFDEICSFNRSDIPFSLPETQNIFKENCVSLCANIDFKYILSLVDSISGSCTTLCTVDTEAVAVILTSFQLTKLIADLKQKEVQQFVTVTKSIPVQLPTLTSEVEVEPPVSEQPDVESTTTEVKPAKLVGAKVENSSSEMLQQLASPSNAAGNNNSAPKEDLKKPIIAAGNNNSAPKEDDLKKPIIAAENNNSAPKEEDLKKPIIAAGNNNSAPKEEDLNKPVIAAGNNNSAPKEDLKKPIIAAVNNNSAPKEDLKKPIIGAGNNNSAPKEEDLNKPVIAAGENDSTPKEPAITTTAQKGKSLSPTKASLRRTTTETDEYDVNEGLKKDDEINGEKFGENEMDLDEHPSLGNEPSKTGEKDETSKLDDTPSSYHFLIYFLAFIVLCVAAYIVFHNKHKIIAFIIEGKQGRRGGRPNTKQYTPLKSKVEDVMPFIEKSTTQSNYIY